MDDLVRLAASVRPRDTVTRLGIGQFVALGGWEGRELAVAVEVALSFASPGATAPDLPRHPRAADDAA